MQLIVNVTGLCGIAQVADDDLRILSAADGPLPPRAVGHGGHGGHGDPQHRDASADATIPDHLPFLEFDIDQTGLAFKDDGGAPLRDIRFKVDREDKKTFAYYLFRNERLCLRRDDPADQPKLNPITITRNNIVDMKEVVTGKDAVNPALVAKGHDPVPSRVSCSFDLRSGKVAASGVDPENVHKFEPTLGAKAYIGAFAQTVSIALDLPGKAWSLRRRAFATDIDPTPILKFTGENNKFEITFGNAPLADILGLHPDVQEEIDVHFALLYKLLNEPPSVLSLPRRVSAFRKKVRVLGTNCPPALLG